MWRAAPVGGRDYTQVQSRAMGGSNICSQNRALSNKLTLHILSRSETRRIPITSVISTRVTRPTYHLCRVINKPHTRRLLRYLSSQTALTTAFSLQSTSLPSLAQATPNKSSELVCLYEDMKTRPKLLNSNRSWM